MEGLGQAPARDPRGLRFLLAWALPVAVGCAAWHSPWTAWAVMAAWQVSLALLERVPGLQRSPLAAPAGPVHRAIPRGHVALQAVLLGVGLAVSLRETATAAQVIALGLAVGGVTGAQGITYAHELGHSRRRKDRALAWMLMASVGYAHFMVEHYRGHHRRAATRDDPATARRGESLWAFLPRTLVGSWRSAWALEAERLAQRGQGWHRSPLAWAVGAQAAGWVALAALGGPWALLFWTVQAAYAVFLLETINYIEHYGLERERHGTAREPFGATHAWNTDACLTNCLLLNLQRHSDHHMHPAKPYATLEALPSPQLPTGYAGCLFLAMVPPLWRRVMHGREPLSGALQAASLTASRHTP